MVRILVVGVMHFELLIAQMALAFLATDTADGTD